MCLCGNLGLLKESGQYSTLAPFNANIAILVHYEKTLLVGAY